MRSIETMPPLTPERMHGGRPILEPHPGHAWESRVVLNPAAVLVHDRAVLDRVAARCGLPEAAVQRLQEAGGACVMLYRAQGEVDPVKQAAPSSLGLAVFTPELELVYRHPVPVLRPEAAFHNLGVEDARCTPVGDTYYLYYTGYSTDDLADPAAPRRVRICLATTTDFVDWTLHGPVAGDLNDVDNKNAALFPEPVDGTWYLFHRPMAGPDAMTIHLAEAASPAGPWRSCGKLFESYRYREFARSWIGAGGPPLALGDGRFLAIYHQGHYTPEGTREYDLAAALLDLRAEDPVRARIEPLMRPSGAAEQVGDPELGVDNVLFTCANYRSGDDLIIPYAAADSRIFGARVNVQALVAALETGAR